MASYNFPIDIEILGCDSEIWSKYCSCYANINKTGGKEYQNASSNIASSTYSFKVRYAPNLDDIIYNTEKYRVIYDNRKFDIKNVDRYAENNTELTIAGEYNNVYNQNNT